jgi:hypothetical protein
MANTAVVNGVAKANNESPEQLPVDLGAKSNLLPGHGFEARDDLLLFRCTHRKGGSDVRLDDAQLHIPQFLIGCYDVREDRFATFLDQ